MPDAAPLDVSGRPLRLRDVDIDAFLHPKTIAVIGASEQSAKPNTAMTRKFDQWAKHHGATFYPVHPEYETVLDHQCYRSIFDIPGDIDLAIILTGRAEQTFEEVLKRKEKFTPEERAAVSRYLHSRCNGIQPSLTLDEIREGLM